MAADSDSAGFVVPPGGCCHGDIHRSAQDHSHVRLRLASQTYRGRVDESGLLEFAGLPVGAAVVSCQGYASDPTVVVGPGSATSSAFGFAEIHPNPTSIALAVTIRLPASTPARLMAFDLQGRRLASRNLRFARAGSYTLQLEEAGTLPPGLYTLRLEQAGRSATTTFTVVR